MASWDRRSGMAASVLSLVVLLCCPPAICAEPAGAVLTIALRGSAPVALSIEALKAMPAASVQVEDDSGSSADYTGITLSALLAASGVEFGKVVRGERLTEYVLVSAADGYRALFSIAEVDPAFTNRTILLCYAKWGASLPEKEGPLRIIARDDGRRARWVRNVTSITVDVAP